MPKLMMDLKQTKQSYQYVSGTFSGDSRRKHKNQFSHLHSTFAAPYIISTKYPLLVQILCGRDALARHLARYIRRCKLEPEIAAGKAAQFVHVPPIQMQLRNLYLMKEISSQQQRLVNMTKRVIEKIPFVVVSMLSTPVI